MLFRHLPNLLSVIRLLLIPVIYNNYLTARTPLDFLLCGVLLVISGITDIADGVIARKFDLITPLGKVLDPVADKLTQIAVALALCMRHRWLWPLLALLVVKDVTMAVLGVYMYHRYHHIGSARWYGKVATVIFYLVTIGIVALPSLLSREQMNLPIYLILGSMLFAGVMYGGSTGLYLLRQRKGAPLPATAPEPAEAPQEASVEETSNNS